METQTVIARPSDGNALVLADTAALVWDRLEDWCEFPALDSVLLDFYPSVSEEARQATLSSILHQLLDDGLLERRSA